MRFNKIAIMGMVSVFLLVGSGTAMASTVYQGETKDGEVHIMIEPISTDISNGIDLQDRQVDQVQSEVVPIMAPLPIMAPDPRETGCGMPENNEILVCIEDEKLDLKENPLYSKNGQLMVPLRSIAEKLRYHLEWNSKDQSIIVNGGKSMLRIGKDQYFFAKMAPFTLGVAPEIFNGKTYVPLTYFSDVLKESVTGSVQIGISPIVH